MNYKEKEFTRMTFPIHGIPGNILSLHSKLNSFEEFRVQTKPLAKDKVVRYILYCYDMKSPIVRNNDDLMKRKYEALILAGFELGEDNKFSGDIERMVLGENDKVNDMIVRFVRIQKSHKYSLLVATEQSYYLKLLKMMDSKINLSKAEHDSARKMEEDIQTLTEELFEGDTTEDLIESLYDSILYDKVELTPEHIATKLMKNEIPVNSRPYGKEVEKYAM